MSQSAFIKFADGSAVSAVTLDELKDRLLHYREQLDLTGKQLGWDYADAAFPYTIVQKPEGENKWFYLKGNNPLYRYIVMGVGSESDEGEEKPFVQVVLPDDATNGDKAKGNEFCKVLGKMWKAEVQLFNGRIVRYNLLK